MKRASTKNGDSEDGTEAGVLEAGRFFMQHRVWTEETLKSERMRRKEIQDEAAELLTQRDKKLEEYLDEESNPLTKVVSYGQAARTMNKVYTSGLKESLFVPYYDDQVIRLSLDCIVSTRGLIFKSGLRELEQIGESRVDLYKGSDDETNEN